GELAREKHRVSHPESVGVRKERVQLVARRKQALRLAELVDRNRQHGERDHDHASDLQLLPRKEGRTLHALLAEGRRNVIGPGTQQASISTLRGSRGCRGPRSRPSLREYR